MKNQAHFSRKTESDWLQMLGLKYLFPNALGRLEFAPKGAAKTDAGQQFFRLDELSYQNY